MRSNASFGNYETVGGVPMRIPHHETLESVVVGVDPVLELTNSFRGGVVGRSSSAT
jgi:hypothetical protein